MQMAHDRLVTLAAAVALGTTSAFAGPDLAFELEPTDVGADLVPALGVTATVQEPVAAPEEVAAPAAATTWHVHVIPAFWVPAKFDGDIDVGPIETQGNLDLGDLLDALDFALEGGIAVSNGDWSILAYGSYFKLGAEVRSQQPLGVAETDMDYELTIFDIAVGKRLARGPLGNGSWRADLLAGGRYWEQKVEIRQSDPVGFNPMIDRRDDWVDAFVGGRVVLDINEAVALWFRGDVGGFSIGSSADLTWTLTAMLELRLSEAWRLVAGYRYVDVDWDKGSGRRRIELDYKIHGPIIGASVRF
jgi:opacity protein-like surface antigen